MMNMEMITNSYHGVKSVTISNIRTVSTADVNNGKIYYVRDVVIELKNKTKITTTLFSDEESSIKI
jgi:hypothetical protein